MKLALKTNSLSPPKSKFPYVPSVPSFGNTFYVPKSIFKIWNIIYVRFIRQNSEYNKNGSLISI